MYFTFHIPCARCHNRGFPSLGQMTKALKGNDKVMFLALQTVFEGHHASTYEKMICMQIQYKIKNFIEHRKSGSVAPIHNPKYIRNSMKVKHDKAHNRFTMDINGEVAKVDYQLQSGKMHLVYSEVPFELRGQGYGKKLVEGTFEKLTEEGHEAVAVCSYVKAVAERSNKWRSIIG